MTFERLEKSKQMKPVYRRDIRCKFFGCTEFTSSPNCRYCIRHNQQNVKTHGEEGDKEKNDFLRNLNLCGVKTVKKKMRKSGKVFYSRRHGELQEQILRYYPDLGKKDCKLEGK